jgi:hypothetical protein
LRLGVPPLQVRQNPFALLGDTLAGYLGMVIAQDEIGALGRGLSLAELALPASECTGLLTAPDRLVDSGRQALGSLTRGNVSVNHGRDPS